MRAYSKNECISCDLDFVGNRKHKLLLEDRINYDEKVADIVADYVDLSGQKNIAQKSGASEIELNHILEKGAISKEYRRVTRKYKELLGGRFRLKAARIDHKEDGNNVAGKVFDYPYKIVEKLIEKENRDAQPQKYIRSLKDQVRELAVMHPIYMANKEWRLSIYRNSVNEELCIASRGFFLAHGLVPVPKLSSPVDLKGLPDWNILLRDRKASSLIACFLASDNLDNRITINPDISVIPCQNSSAVFASANVKSIV